VGQRGPGTTCGEGIPGRSGSPELSSGRNSGEVGPDVGDGGLGGVPGAQANLLRWLGLAGERRSTAGTAVQGARRGGAERGGALGLVRLRQGEVVGAEGHRGHFKKARASWAGVPRKEISPGIQAGLAQPLRERDPEEGDGADQRGHGVSGRSAGDALGRAGLTGWASARHGPSGRRRAGWAAREGREQAEPGRGERVGRTA